MNPIAIEVAMAATADKNQLLDQQRQGLPTHVDNCTSHNEYDRREILGDDLYAPCKE
jgi:hypothetical protein